jgi:hypothetical protein
MKIPGGLFRAWIVFAALWLGIGFLLLTADWWYHGIAATLFDDLLVLIAVPACLLMGLWLTARLGNWIVGRIRKSA